MYTEWSWQNILVMIIAGLLELTFIAFWCIILL